MTEWHLTTFPAKYVAATPSVITTDNAREYITFPGDVCPGYPGAKPSTVNMSLYFVPEIIVLKYDKDRSAERKTITDMYPACPGPDPPFLISPLICTTNHCVKTA